MSQKRFILASASPRRLALLAQIGFTPGAVLAADVNEAPLKGETPVLLAQRLACAKAEAVKTDGAIVLGADTVVAVGRRILPKAENEAEARACLKLLSGRTHRVYTGVAVHDGKTRVRVAEARVTFKQLTAQEIEFYIASGEWRGKAGGYAIQGLAGAFASRIIGSYSAIVGLPLYETAHLLRAAGLEPIAP
jgi:septum formation protein